MSFALNGDFNFKPFNVAFRLCLRVQNEEYLKWSAEKHQVRPDYYAKIEDMFGKTYAFLLNITEEDVTLQLKFFIFDRKLCSLKQVVEFLKE
jgi:hypothetical protein